MEEKEGGSQALAQPVMIDWLAGSQQTDVRPPDRPTHPFYPRRSLHPRALALLTQPLPALARLCRRPWSGLAQKARDTMHDCHPPCPPLGQPPHPPRVASSFLLSRAEALRLAILSYRYPFNPFSSEPPSHLCARPRVCARVCAASATRALASVQKPGTGR